MRKTISISATCLCCLCICVACTPEFTPSEQFPLVGPAWDTVPRALLDTVPKEEYRSHIVQSGGSAEDWWIYFDNAKVYGVFLSSVGLKYLDIATQDAENPLRLWQLSSKAGEEQRAALLDTLTSRLGQPQAADDREQIVPRALAEGELPPYYVWLLTDEGSRNTKIPKPYVTYAVLSGTEGEGFWVQAVFTAE